MRLIKINILSTLGSTFSVIRVTNSLRVAKWYSSGNA